MIDYATLHRWLNRNKSQVHGAILANLDNLIRMAIMYDDYKMRVAHLENRVSDLMRSIQILNNDKVELKQSACKRFDCDGRK